MPAISMQVVCHFGVGFIVVYLTGGTVRGFLFVYATYL